MKLLSFILCLFIPFLAFSQSLEDISFLEAQDLRTKLNLSLKTTNQVEEILNDFKLQTKEIIKDSKEKDATFNEQYNLLIEERNKRLKEILSADQFSLFKLMEKGQLEGSKAYYSYLVRQLSDNQDFKDELWDFNIKQQFPVIAKHKQNLYQSISTKDSLTLQDLGTEFIKILRLVSQEVQSSNEDVSDQKLKQLVKSVQKEDNSVKEPWKQIRKLKRKYKEELEKEVQAIDAYNKEWNQAVKDILMNHLSFEEEGQIDELFFVLNKYGISREISKIALLVFDNSNPASYFEIRALIQQLFMTQRSSSQES